MPWRSAGRPGDSFSGLGFRAPGPSGSEEADWGGALSSLEDSQENPPAPVGKCRKENEDEALRGRG